MKPPIEYRQKQSAQKRASKAGGSSPLADRDQVKDVVRSHDGREAKPVLQGRVERSDSRERPATDFIVIRRNRAKYNAYMRAYRAKKKAEKP